MTTQAAAGGFLSTCPHCDWERWTTSRKTAAELLAAHRCKGGEK